MVSCPFWRFRLVNSQARRHAAGRLWAVRGSGRGWVLIGFGTRKTAVTRLVPPCTDLAVDRGWGGGGRGSWGDEFRRKRPWVRRLGRKSRRAFGARPGAAAAP